MELTVIALGGPPASGKSTLMKEVLDGTSDPKYNGNKFKWGELIGNFYTDDSLVVYGRYGSSRDFEGTDALSMSANNHAKQFTDMLTEIDRFDKVIFEGDRLFNQPFLDMCRENPEIDLRAYILDVPNEELDRRHEEREDDHTEKWKNGMRTQYENYATEKWTTTLENVTEEDMERNRKFLQGEIGIGSGNVEAGDESAGQNTFEVFE